MYYFSFFPDIIKGQTLTKDITKRWDILDKILKEDKYFDTIELSEAETIESVANRVYGSPEYSWLVLISNRHYNPFFSNFKSDAEMTDYIKRKYSINMFDIHHLETLQGTILDEVDTYNYNRNKYDFANKDIIEISYDIVERRENFKRRFIKVIKSNYLSQIISELTSLF